jgi:hypothetical protein
MPERGVSPPGTVREEPASLLAAGGELLTWACAKPMATKAKAASAAGLFMIERMMNSF